VFLVEYLIKWNNRNYLQRKKEYLDERNMFSGMKTFRC